MSLIEFCKTDRQREIIQAVEACDGKIREAARQLGVDHSLVSRVVATIKAYSAARGHAPEHDMTRVVPAGFLVKGTSTLYDRKGEIAAQWVKTRLDPQKFEEMMADYVSAMCEDIPHEQPVEPPGGGLNSALLNQYTITDYHFGMLAWAEETGADWDVSIAEDTLVKWFQAAIKQAPDAEVGIFAQLGDMMHWDGLEAVTPTSKHVLDADTRFSKVVRVAIRAMRRIIRMLLQKHQRVHVIMAEGNHDIASSVWLREMFAALYEDEPRITVDTSPDPYYCYEHDEVSLFYHHGHKKKPENIDDVFVAKFREVFGRTKKSYAHMGHMHHVYQKETSLMLVEQHRTLAAPDAHASRGGWMSSRDARVITYHKKYGEVGRITICPEMLS